MPNFLLILFCLLLAACSTTQGVREPSSETAPSARSPEVLSTYSQSGEFLEASKKLQPKIGAMCADLLASQLKLQKETDSWKLYSLYEMLQKQALMTHELVRVPTVTELSGAVPRYTSYRLAKEPLASAAKLKDGSLLIADKGSQCGPDPLSLTKGAYFLKCGEFLIGSGLIKTENLNLKQCLNIRVLRNPNVE